MNRSIPFLCNRLVSNHASMSAAPRLVIAFLLVTLTASSLHAQTVRQEFWGTNWYVNDMVASGNTIYIAGSFDWIGSPTGGFAAMNTTSGAVTETFDINGNVNAAAPDGSGGWFIGGNFSMAKGQQRIGLAHVYSDGTLAPWNPGQLDGTQETEVFALLKVGGTIYAGGQFSQIGGQSRHYIAALDETTGAATAWDPGSSFFVRALAENGGTIYAGGGGGTIGGQTRYGVAAIDAAGNATAWNPNVTGGSVYTLELWPATNTLYIGGEFSTVGGVSCSRLGAVDLTTAALSTWRPNPNGPVYDLALSTSGSTVNSVYVGGSFSTIGWMFPTSVANLALVEPGLGFVQGVGNVDGTVRSLQLSGTTLYVGGWFSTVGSQPRNRIAAVNASNLQTTSWNPGCGFEVRVLAIGPSGVYAGGAYQSYGGSLGGKRQSYLMAVDAVTGQPRNWNPAPNGNVYALAVDGNTVYAGGIFDTIGGQYRPHVAAIDGTTGLPTPWDPIFSGGTVTDLILDENNLYAMTLYDIDKYDVGVNGQLNWHLHPYPVGFNAMAISGQNLYVDGYFSTIGGQPRHGLAAIDKVTALATPWDPNPNDLAGALEVSGSKLYISGKFNSIAGENRPGLALFDNEVLSDWSPVLNSPAGDMELVGNMLYVSTSVSGFLEATGILAINATSGGVTPWANAFVAGGRLMYDNGSLYNYGYIRSAQGKARSSYAAFSQVTTGVEHTPAIPPGLSVRVFPNPFTAEASFVFTLAAAAKVQVEVYDVQGRLVRRLDLGTRPIGEQRIVWNGRNDAGRGVSSGTYFTRVRAGSQSASAKLLLVR